MASYNGAAGGVSSAAQINTALGLVSGRTTVAGAAATTIAITGLAGNTQGDYELYGRLLLVANPVFNLITIQPNADSGNAESDAISSITSTVAGSSVARLDVAAPNTTTNAVTLNFRVRIKSKAADGLRYYEAGAYWLDGSGSARSTQQATGRWTDVANEITSLVVVSNQASSMSIGSYVAWRSLGFTA